MDAVLAAPYRILSSLRSPRMRQWRTRWRGCATAPSIGLQVGLRRTKIAASTVGDLHQNRGYNSLRVIRKGGRHEALAVNPQVWFGCGPI